MADFNVIPDDNSPLIEELADPSTVFPGKLYEEIWFQILVSCIIILLTLIPLIFLLRKSKSKRDVLLLGLSDSGKTLIYSRLLHGNFVQTQTSIKENVGEYERENGGSVRIVDIPGHERLRLKFYEDYKATTKAIIFVIDSSTLQKDVRDVAEFLYTILTDASVKILILCNKQDVLTSKSSTVISQILQKELNTLRVTKGSQLESIDSSKNKSNVLGKEGKEFEFSSIPKITFGESTALFKDENEPADLKGLTQWLESV